MPVSVINNIATQDTYADAVTMVFGRPRKSFGINVLNAAVFYQVGWTTSPVARIGNFEWESSEHHLIPSFAQFSDPADEGLPDGSLFQAVRIRSAVAGTPARVTVY